MDDQNKSALLVDAREAARMLSVSQRKLWGLTFEDQSPIPHVRLGRLVRYRPGDLQSWIDRQRTGGAQ